MVSIILPVYNTEKYISRCIESIIAQTYKNWELIIIDDGSNDASGKICMDYMKRDSRIYYHHQYNQGVSVARNKGIFYASGKYLYFIDSDDEAEDNLLQTVLSYMEKDNLDMICFNVKALAEEGEPYWTPVIKEREYQLLSVSERCEFMLKDFLDCQMMYSPWNKMYRTSLVKKNEIFFEEGVKMGEDMGFNLKYLFYARKVKGISDSLYKYWKRDGSAMSIDSGEVFWIKDFSHMLAGVKKTSKNVKCRQSEFSFIFIKAMDNQYGKRKQRQEFKPYIKLVENKVFFLYQTLDVLCHPKRMVKLFGNPEAKRKWKDHLYGLRYVLGL